MSQSLEPTDVCRNCGSPDVRRYCAACGQKTYTERFNLRDSLHWTVSKIFDLEHGFLHTTLELLKNPGQVLREYLGGATVNYSHPFRFILLWSTISVLISVWIGAFDVIAEQMSMVENSTDQQRMINEYMFKYMNFIIVATIPFMSIWNLLFYRKRRLNFTEHSLVNAFAMGASTAVGILFSFMYLIPDITAWTIPGSLILMSLITGRVYSQFYKEHFLLSVFKFLLIYVLATITVMIITTIVVIIATILPQLMAG